MTTLKNVHNGNISDIEKSTKVSFQENLSSPLLSEYQTVIKMTISKEVEDFWNISDIEKIRNAPIPEQISKGKNSQFQELFSNFCNNSTIHGIYFCNASITGILGRIIWGIIVCVAMIISAWSINNSFAHWQEHPVITKVEQESIEVIPFPAITICPSNETG